MTKKIGFLSFGFWQPEHSVVKTAKQSYEESVQLAVEAEKLGVDGAWCGPFRARLSSHADRYFRGVGLVGTAVLFPPNQYRWYL